MQLAELGQIDLNLLLTLRVFVEQGGVAEAAEALGRSQPAISARLRRLEEDLGVALFERVGRRLRLTPVGRSVDEDARVVVGDLRRALDRLRAFHDRPVGTVRVGALPTVGVHVVAPALGRLAERFPEVGVRLSYRLAEEHLPRLRSGEIDMVVSVGRPPVAGDVEVVTLQPVRPAFVTRRGEAPGDDPVDLGMSDRPYLGYGPVPDPFFDAVWAHVESLGIDRAVRTRVAHIQTLKAMVAAGVGVTVLPDYTVVEPDLAARPVAGLDFEQPMWLAVRRSAWEIPAIAEVRAALLTGPG